MTTPHILLVDDDQALLQALPEALRLRMGDLTIDTCDSAMQALERVAAYDYDAIVSDIKMPGMDGLALLGRIRELRPDIPTLLITGHGEHELAIQALRGSAYDFIQKPIDREYFVASLWRAIQVRALRRQVEEQRQALEQHADVLERTVAERTHELAAANEQKDAMLRARDAALADAEAAQQRLAYLAEASALLSSSLDFHEVLHRLARLSVPRLADWCVIHVVGESGRPELVALAHMDPAKEDLVRQMENAYPLTARTIGGTNAVIESGKPALFSSIDPQTAPQYARSDLHRDLLRALAPVSYMCVPMIARGSTLGAIAFVSSGSGRHFTAADLALAEELAGRAAVAADNARLYAAAQEALREQREARQQAELLARLMGKQAAELDAIIEGMAEGVYVCGADGRLVRVNRRGRELLPSAALMNDRPLSDIVGYADLFRADGTPLPPEEYPLLRGLRGEVGTDLTLLVRHPAPAPEQRLRFSFAPIRGEHGELLGAVAVAHDVTELEQLQRQKDEFLSVASHELKTPLTSLKGLTQLTRRRVQRGGEPVDAHLQRMEQAILRMELLVNDLLDVSRIESGKLALTTERRDLRTLCEQIADEQMAATERAIRVKLPKAPVEVEIDADRIGQVLTNLLSNALKYSPPGSPVTLALTTTAREALITVRDAGAGIPPEELPRVFERFYRVPGIEVQYGSAIGLGLGLFISHEIVERHGGSIRVESERGKGSCFTVALPLIVTRPDSGVRAPVSEEARSSGK